MIQTDQTYKDYIADTGVIGFEILIPFNQSSSQGGEMTYWISFADCKEGTFKMVDELCPSGEFSVGNTVATRFEVELRDALPMLNADFEHARLYFGIPNENGTLSHSYQRGVFAIERNYVYGKMTKIVGYDLLSLSDYNSANINNLNIGQYASWQALVQGLGFTLDGSWNPYSPDNNLTPLPDITVNAEYGLENATKRTIAGYVAQAFCCNLKMNNKGKLKRVFFPGQINTQVDESIVGTAIVGTATIGDEYVIDSRIVRTDKILDPPEIYGETVECDSIAVKAIDGTVVQGSIGSGNTFNYYICDNPLIRDGVTAQHIVNQGEQALDDAFYAPFSVNVIGDPSWESGDIIRLVDEDGNVTYSVITSFQYTLGGASTLSCQIEDLQSYSSIDQQVADSTTNVNVISSGETVTLMEFVGFGWVTNARKTLWILIPFSKYIGASGFTVTSIDYCYLRQSDGGYVYYNDGSTRTSQANVTMMYDSIEAQILPQQGLLIKATCTHEWYRNSTTAIDNNVVVQINGTLTGTFS